MAGCVTAYVINDAFKKRVFYEMAFFKVIFLRVGTEKWDWTEHQWAVQAIEEYAQSTKT